jgi:hypothetical protein
MSVATDRKIKAGRLVAERLIAAGNHKEGNDIKSLATALAQCSNRASEIHRENLQLRARLKALGEEV